MSNKKLVVYESDEEILVFLKSEEEEKLIEYFGANYDLEQYDRHECNDLRIFARMKLDLAGIDEDDEDEDDDYDDSFGEDDDDTDK